MAATKHPEAPVIVAGYDWGALGHVVDVGGGGGILQVVAVDCATAAGEDGAVFVIEKVTDGQARDVPQLEALAESAGLTVTAVHTADDVAIVELAPA